MHDHLVLQRAGVPHRAYVRINRRRTLRTLPGRPIDIAARESYIRSIERFRTAVRPSTSVQTTTMMKSPGSLVRSHFPRLLYGMYLAEVARALEGCSSVLDIGCGAGSPLRHLGIDRLVGVDGYGPAIEEARSNNTHHEFHLSDVRTIGEAFPPKSFDAVVALDLIEHLTKEEGHKLLAGMERIASRRIVIFTPNGFVPQMSQDGDLQEHLSGWEPREMRGFGYDVFGLHGPKFLRGEYHKSKFLPRPLAGVISSAAQVMYSRSHPESAAAILCVKSLEPTG